MQLKGFQVFNFRNIIDSGWIDASAILALVGQNECGKSNLLTALCLLNPYESTKYDVKSDWPIDRWPHPADANEKVVCKTQFALSAEEIAVLFKHAEVEETKENNGEATPADAADATKDFPTALDVIVTRNYANACAIELPAAIAGRLDMGKATKWIALNLPKCIYMDDYQIFQGHAELDSLLQKVQKHGREKVSDEEKTILITLELAGLNIDELAGKVGTEAGRTERGFDTNAASGYLTKQFKQRWKQKVVKFNIRVDGPTLDIHVEDEGLGAFVPLQRRSRGFQWFVSFIWRFTYASKGEFANCILLLDEPGVHLHHAGHKDLLDFFEDLSKTNTVIYTTHLATMLDPAYPERVRIVEVHHHHAAVTNSMVSTQKEPMMVIEAVLGLSGGMSGLLGSRQNLIVEGGADAVILYKLSGVMQHSNEEGLSERIFLIPARGASKTPMYAAFMVGNGWDAGVLLDSDQEGHDAKTKIKTLYLDGLAADSKTKFRIFMLGDVADIQNESAIEDLFPAGWYLECVNEAYGTNLTEADLPQDGSPQICKRVEHALKQRGRASELDKHQVMRAVQKRFDKIKTKDDLPQGTYEKARKLIGKINAAFS